MDILKESGRDKEVNTPSDIMEEVFNLTGTTNVTKTKQIKIADTISECREIGKQVDVSHTIDNQCDHLSVNGVRFTARLGV